MIIVAFDGSSVVLSDERWRHIVLRHPELREKRGLILDAVTRPDEVYADSAGGVHVLKRLSGDGSDFLVVVYAKSGVEGYIRTAYYTSSRKKSRRYRGFRRLRLS